jgi:hypothetical protein
MDRRNFFGTFVSAFLGGVLVARDKLTKSETDLNYLRIAKSELLSRDCMPSSNSKITTFPPKFWVGFDYGYPNLYFVNPITETVELIPSGIHPRFCDAHIRRYAQSKGTGLRIISDKENEGSA